MNKEEAKQLIIDTLIAANGCKWIELLWKESLLPIYTDYEINDLISELIQENKIVEICYVLPYLDRVKSFLLPGGTKIL